MQETGITQKLFENQERDQETEYQKEKQHLKQCVNVIQGNIDEYILKFKEISAETKELYDNYRSANPELHNDLVIGLDIKSQLEKTLNKNLRAVKKPYFGRIDYMEKGDDKKYTLYLGKNGIRKNISENLIIDWRATISSVYYESDIGESFYHTPFGETIDINLMLKRTYEIEESKLIDFYDSDVVTNDDFLTKYLSKNKEVILGEIIATIQKEQNDIIRDTPFHSVIVQGVAGSGKTTVAMHRISYILYNFKDKFRPDEFFIIGSNKMLLDYITGVLPNLDVYNVNQMTMEDFLLTLLDKDFNLKKEKYTLSNSFLKLQAQVDSGIKVKLKRFKGSMDFAKALELYLDQYEIDHLTKIPSQNYDDTPEDIRNDVQDNLLYTEKEILYFINFFQDKPFQEKVDILNKRLIYKLKSISEEKDLNKNVIQAEVKKYSSFYGNRTKKIKLMEVYTGFLEDLKENRQIYVSNQLNIPEAEVIISLLLDLKYKHIDIYDLGMLTFIKKRLKLTKDFEYVSHIVVDEAQDFGVIIFYLCRKLFRDCTYTIMGDISQNIYYDTGMNDWEVLKNEVFQPDKDKFYVLAKSYRNTVEISEYATRVLNHCSFQTYDIEPIIRHGKEVEVKQCENEKELVSDTVRRIKSIQKEGYDTIAIICRTIEETRKVQKLLEKHVTLEQPEEDIEEMTFKNGVMVLPIHMTKGLEFDAVILWNPDEMSYHASDENAKLMYVAVTRALHELHIVYQGMLSKLLIN